MDKANILNPEKISNNVCYQLNESKLIRPRVNLNRILIPSDNVCNRLSTEILTEIPISKP